MGSVESVLRAVEWVLPLGGARECPRTVVCENLRGRLVFWRRYLLAHPCGLQIGVVVFVSAGFRWLGILCLVSQCSRAALWSATLVCTTAPLPPGRRSTSDWAQYTAARENNLEAMDRRVLHDSEVPPQPSPLWFAFMLLFFWCCFPSSALQRGPSSRQLLAIFLPVGIGMKCLPFRVAIGTAGVACSVVAASSPSPVRVAFRVQYVSAQGRCAEVSTSAQRSSSIANAEPQSSVRNAGSTRPALLVWCMFSVSAILPGHNMDCRYFFLCLLLVVHAWAAFVVPGSSLSAV